jgi:SAM-dependent methyltransferase
MLAQAEETLAQFEGRFELRPFGLNRRDWLEHLPADLRCFVSSLAIHHLDGPEKQQLFRDLRHRLPPGGVLLIADLVEPVNDWARSAYARAWDEAVRERSVRLVGTLEPYERFRDGWNHYVTPDVDFDKPSGLFEQLKWLEAAGFSRVDCFWLRAGHAIYGGYS